jgi:hypothetical protein
METRKIKLVNQGHEDRLSQYLKMNVPGHYELAMQVEDCGVLLWGACSNVDRYLNSFSPCRYGVKLITIVDKETTPEVTLSMNTDSSSFSKTKKSKNKMNDFDYENKNI